MGMNTLLQWLWVVVTLAFAVPVLTLVLELWMARRPPRGERCPSLDPAHAAADTRTNPAPAHALPRTVALVPAHNEAAGLTDTLRPLLSSPAAAWLQVWVVADNCSDDTAAVARQAGAHVVERHNLALRGKGHALAAGVAALVGQPPEVVIVLDADCLTTLADMATLSQACHHAQRPLQSAYLMQAPASAGLGLRVAEFAWRIKTWVRPLGWRHLGQGGSLLGSGMAFPWPVMAQLPWASGHITEDLSLSFRLAERQATPLFFPQARVNSSFPTSEEAQQVQRTRWEHGHLGILTTEVPRALWRGVVGGQRSSLVLALYVLVPPLALLVLSLAAATAAAALTGLLTGALWPVLAMVSLTALLVASLAAAWSRWGQDVMKASDWLHIPVYVWRKLGIYGRWARQPETQWTRTERDTPVAPTPTADNTHTKNDTAS